MTARYLRAKPVLVAAALALAGCGDYSTEDLRFLAALPQREDLKVEVPATAAVAAAKGATAPMQALGDACGRPAELWGWAKPASDDLNAFVDFLVGLVDGVRSVPPSWRDDDARAWGPFDDQNHPGREIQIGMVRTYPGELGGAPRYVYALNARVKGTPDFTTIILGTFDGASASRGKGELALDWNALRALDMHDANTPFGAMWVGYDRIADPVTIRLVQDPDGPAGPEVFGYQFAGYAAGGGVFDYAVRDASANTLFIAARYDAAGAGRARVAFQPAGGAVAGYFDQCWDAGATLVYVDDPGNYSCDEAPLTPPECTCGDPVACVPVPESPFPP